MSVKDSPFRTWFKEQYGRLPTTGRLAELSKELESAQAMVTRIKWAISAEERLADCWQNAFYGWNAAKATRKKK